MHSTRFTGAIRAAHMTRNSEAGAIVPGEKKSVSTPIPTGMSFLVRIGKLSILALKMTSEYFIAFLSQRD
jgi:hypothetical protein